MTEQLVAIVPAAGVGQRMRADRPKQYLKLHGKSIVEHSIERLLSHPQITQVVVALSAQDHYFSSLAIAQHPKVSTVVGGQERADSVLNAARYVHEIAPTAWVLVHDAARPCITHSDISALIAKALAHPVGAILATPVRDTLKRAKDQHSVCTVDRQNLWQALTPQMFPVTTLVAALTQALADNQPITDEASAFEYRGQAPALVTGRADNIKITQPEDLAFAEFYLQHFGC